jgi:outer membrane protein assembly factor BamB
VSRETGLPEKLSLPGGPAGAGEGLLWSVPEGGRSTPVISGGQVYVLNNAGQGVDEEERILALDALTGKTLWEHRFSIFLTDIPSSRVGWASPVVDPETGQVYAHGVQGTFLCLDRAGKLVWERSLHEEYGVISGYGGRTHTPIVDEDLVIISFLNSSWGPHARGSHRYVAFNKGTGAVVWWAEPGGPPYDTTYSTPVVAVVGGVRLLIGGNADGGVYALKVRTGEKVWGFKASERGINVSVVCGGDRVYLAHSEENIDSVAMGRVVCIDATGTGDVTKTHEVWRLDEVPAGYSSPALHDGTLYICDNSANLLAIDAASGKLRWKHSVGTVMKGSPVVADGKIYVGEVNGKFLILKPGKDSCETVSEVAFTRPDGTVVEIFGSPAIANGRVYFTTRDGVFCVGPREWKGAEGEIPAGPREVAASAEDAPAHLQVTPGDVVVSPGESVVFKGNLFDAKGRFLGTCTPSWSLKGIQGAASESGKLTVAGENVFQQGSLVGTLEGLTAEARVRVLPPLPFSMDFNSLPAGAPPPGWVGAGVKFVVTELEGEKVLTKAGKDARFLEAETFFGMPWWRNYTFEADVRGSETRRNLPNIALVNTRYTFVLMGNTQRLRLLAWTPQPRLEKTIPFPWKPDVWYTMKVRVEEEGGRALVRGKAWQRGEAEPEGWSVEMEDPKPHRSGSPALQGYSAGITARSPGAEIHYDNVKVYAN